MALSWAYLVRASRQMSATMDYDMAMAAMGMRAAWQPADAWLTFQMWLAMMIAMMSASAAPVLLLFSATTSATERRGVPVVLVFGAGYLAIWAAFSLAATLAQWALYDAALLSPSMRVSDTLVSGGVLAAAGLYQLTPVKAACLRHCRSPLGFLMAGWRHGIGGAFRMGAGHGLYCLGCCWALMAVLFVVGVMNLVWVAVLGGVVLLEKAGPAGMIAARVAGAVLLMAGVGLVAFFR